MNYRSIEKQQLKIIWFSCINEFNSWDQYKCTSEKKFGIIRKNWRLNILNLAWRNTAVGCHIRFRWWRNRFFLYFRRFDEWNSYLRPVGDENGQNILRNIMPIINFQKNIYEILTTHTFSYFRKNNKNLTWKPSNNS